MSKARDPSTIEAATLRAMAADPAVFRQHILVDCDGVPRPLTESSDPRMAADFTDLDDGWRQVVGGRSIAGARQRGYWERGRGSAKTTSAAVSVCWPLFASRRPLSMIAAAADRDQARLVRDSVARLAALNPWLSSVLDVQAYRVTNTKTESTLDILSNDVASSWGHTPDAVLIDELVAHGDRRELFDSLYSAAAKKKHCVLLITSNAGIGMGDHNWTWTVRETARTDPAWVFSRWDSPAYWIDQARLDEQRRMLPSFTWRRIWGNEWIALGAALVPESAMRAYRVSGDDQNAAYHLLHPDGSLKLAVPIRDCTRAAYIDPAGSSADKDSEGRGRTLSWSVISTIDHTPTGQMVVVHVTRRRCEVPQLMVAIDTDVARFNPSRVCTENAGIGLAVWQLLRSGPHGGIARALEPKGRDKLTRFAKALTMLEHGDVYFDPAADWYPAMRTELLTLTGGSRDTWDQADTLAYAAMDAREISVPAIVPDAGAFIMGRGRSNLGYSPFSFN